MEYQYNYNYELLPEAGFGLIFATMIIPFIIILAVYVYYAVCLMVIARKTATPNGWMAWIPILNIVLMLQIAKRPVWWIVLLFIPLVNIVVSIIVWMDVAVARGKPNWLGVLMIVPVANIVVPGYLAFSR